MFRPRITSLVVGAAITAGAVAIGNFVARRRAHLRRQVLSELRTPSECTALHAAKIARIPAQLRAHPTTRPVSLRKHVPPRACGGRRDVIAVVTDPDVARTLLLALDLPHEPSAFAPARSPTN